HAPDRVHSRAVRFVVGVLFQARHFQLGRHHANDRSASLSTGQPIHRRQKQSTVENQQAFRFTILDLRFTRLWSREGRVAIADAPVDGKQRQARRLSYLNAPERHSFLVFEAISFNPMSSYAFWTS